MSAFTFAVTGAFQPRYRIHYSPWLYPRPRLERTRFSGGVNLSAEQRNEARIQEWRKSMKVAVDHANQVVVVPEPLREEFETSLRKAGIQ